MFSIEKANASDPKLQEAFESGRPLHSTLLYAKSLGLNSKPEYIRSYYSTATLAAELKSIGDGILKQFPEISQNQIAAFDSVSDLNAFSKKLKKSKRSKAALSKNLGLEDKAKHLLEATSKGVTKSIAIPKYFEDLVISDKEELNSVEKVEGLISGCINELLNDDAYLQKEIRSCIESTCTVSTKEAPNTDEKKDRTKFKAFFNFKESFKNLLKPEFSLKYLNLRRGVSQGDLTLDFDFDSAKILEILTHKLAPMSARAGLDASLVDWVIKFSEQYVAALRSSTSKELSSKLRSNAEQLVLPKIKENLKRVLLSPGVGRQNVLGISPSGKQTCRISVIDREGLHKESAQVPFLEGEKSAETEAVFLALIEKHQVQAIAISDHAGARGIERFMRSLFKSVKISLPIALLPAETCDDYASSKSGQEDFPELDTPTRKSIFTARQLQDPLREFVRVKAKSLGVGQFLNEVHPESLATCLEEVTKDVVHQVGVDLNSASATLLSKVDGIDEELAKKIIAFREDKGFFWSREQVLDVEGMTEELFEYCGPFLRVKDGKLLSDNSFLHPKHNKAILEAFKRLKVDHAKYSEKSDALLTDEKLVESLGKELVGEFVQALKTATPDPRGKFEFIQFRDDIQKVSDLKIGMICPGRVSNVTSFGAFVDVGLPQDGLVHLSELASTFVRDPYDVIHPGDVVTVKVLAIDPDKKQISFSMKGLTGGAERNQEIEKRSKEAQAKAPKPNPRPQHKSFAERAAGEGRKGPRDGKGKPSFKPGSRPAGKGGPRGKQGGGASDKSRSPNRPEGLRNNAFAALANLKVD